MAAESWRWSTSPSPRRFAKRSLGPRELSPRSSPRITTTITSAATTKSADEHPGVRVFGYKSDRGRIPGQTEFLRDGETFKWGKSEVRALHIPGHTTGAVAYVVGDAVFTGDTLFLAGCGRLFEGTPAMMHHSLNDVLVPLGPGVRVFCGHEYTVSNLHFAASVEPDNAR